MRSTLGRMHCQRPAHSRRGVAVVVEAQASSSGRLPVPPVVPAPSGGPKPDPFRDMPKTIYRDSPADLAFIKVYADKIAEQLARSGQRVYVPMIASYDDFVRVSKDIMRGRSPEDQRLLVRQVLFSLLPPVVVEQFKRLFPPTQLSAEVNARMASLGFGWLVGECELQEDNIVVGPNGETRRQASVVLIKRCRYLEASGCVGLCTNLCKLPTQSFFTDDCGLPLTMEPNFDDLSCKMIFGQAPPPLDADPVYGTPCYRPQCSMGSDNKAAPCPKLKAAA